MSIIRVGLAETKHFSEGYDAIFGKKKTSTSNKKRVSKTASRKKKPKRK